MNCSAALDVQHSLKKWKKFCRKGALVQKNILRINAAFFVQMASVWVNFLASSETLLLEWTQFRCIGYTPLCWNTMTQSRLHMMHSKLQMLTGDRCKNIEEQTFCSSFRLLSSDAADMAWIPISSDLALRSRTTLCRLAMSSSIAARAAFSKSSCRIWIKLEIK